MSKLLITSDSHLGHNNITKYRTGFSSAEEHHEVIFDNIASTVSKRDTVWFYGDTCFTVEWLERIKGLKCKHKKLILGNHDNGERGLTIEHLVDTYDSIESLLSKGNMWHTHCPIHPGEIRGRVAVIHGHLHNSVVDDPRYLNICVEHTDWKPLWMEDAKEVLRSRGIEIK